MSKILPYKVLLYMIVGESRMMADRPRKHARRQITETEDSIEESGSGSGSDLGRDRDRDRDHDHWEPQRRSSGTIRVGGDAHR